jgi:hypothetical protein
MDESRKLAAVLVADVVGFSRLTGTDGDHTLARRALRSDLIDPTIAVHKGRLVKRTGDRAIVEFRSVVDAVRCAIEIQNSMISVTLVCRQSGALNFAAAFTSASPFGQFTDENAHPSKCRLLGGHRGWLTCGQSGANDPLSDPSLFSIYRGENDAKFFAFHS